MKVDPLDQEVGVNTKRFVRKFQKLGYGIEFLGWFQSTVSGNFVTNQLIEGLAQQQLINSNAFILINNLSSVGQEVSIKALRLSTGFMNAYVDGKWKSKDLESNKISYLNIFEELNLEISNQNWWMCICQAYH